MRRLLVAALLLAAGPALAHVGPPHVHGSFGNGVLHPLGGIDHVLAMVAVGLWAALAGGRALLLFPAAFLGGLLAGGMLAIGGFGLPLVEPGILASIVVLGAAVAFALEAPLPAALALIAAFGLLHGHAHGAEMPDLAAPVPYAAGFVLATAALHGVGLAAGRFALALRRPLLLRGAGALTCLGGILLVLS
jgi:urease accessory protein